MDLNQDPYQNVTDPQHWKNPKFSGSLVCVTCGGGGVGRNVIVHVYKWSQCSQLSQEFNKYCIVSTLNTKKTSIILFFNFL